MKQKSIIITSVISIIYLLILPSITLSAETPFKIGVYGPMTGPASETGHHIQNGATLAAEEINASGGILGRKIELIFGDDEAKPTSGVAMMERLIINDKVELVTGGLNSDVALATMDVTAKYGIPQICNTPVSDAITKKIVAKPDFYKYVVKNGPSAARYGQVSWPNFIEYLIKENHIDPQNKTIAFIRERTSFALSLEKSITKGVTGKGWKVVSRETVDVDQSDYRAVLTKIRALNPAIIFPIQTSVPSGVALRKQFIESGSPSQYFTNFLPSNPDYLKLSGSKANNIVWVINIMILPTEKGNSFRQKYQKRFGIKPDMTSALQYDLMHMIKIAYETAKGWDNGEFMNAFLDHKYEGTTGVYSYDKVKHLIKSGPDYIPTLAFQIQKEDHVLIWPAKYAQGPFLKD